VTGTAAIDVLFGAALVAIGVLASALADRIRGIRAERKTQERARGVTPQPEPTRRDLALQKSGTSLLERDKPPRASSIRDTIASDVIAALVASGYKRPIATEAVWSCGLHERASIEAWTRAALRRCASGGPS
jgi:hypothetical protein